MGGGRNNFCTTGTHGFLGRCGNRNLRRFYGTRGLDCAGVYGYLNHPSCQGRAFMRRRVLKGRSSRSTYGRRLPRVRLGPLIVSVSNYNSAPSLRARPMSPQTGDCCLGKIHLHASNNVRLLVNGYPIRMLTTFIERVRNSLYWILTIPSAVASTQEILL